MKKLLLVFVITSLNTFALSMPPKTSITNNMCAPIQPGHEIGQAVKWYRDSSEKIALYQQAFTMGNYYIQNKIQAIDAKPGTWGVVLDIDETTLDNSWYNKLCDSSPTSEADFSKYVVLQQKSIATPGVKKFTWEIKNTGGYVSLISNRDGSYPGILDSTIKNLKAQGICFDQVILSNRKTDKTPTDKNPRFSAVLSGTCNDQLMVCSNKLPAHRVIAFFGDNIQDFPRLKQSGMIKLSPEDLTYTHFASGYFILPNPLYGSWESNRFN